MESPSTAPASRFPGAALFRATRDWLKERTRRELIVMGVGAVAASVGTVIVIRKYRERRRVKTVDEYSTGSESKVTVTTSSSLEFDKSQSVGSRSSESYKSMKVGRKEEVLTKSSGARKRMKPFGHRSPPLMQVPLPPMPPPPSEVPPEPKPPPRPAPLPSSKPLPSPTLPPGKLSFSAEKIQKKDETPLSTARVSTGKASSPKSDAAKPLVIKIPANKLTAFQVSNEKGSKEKSTQGSKEKVARTSKEKLTGNSKEKSIEGSREKFSGGSNEKVSGGSRESISIGSKEKFSGASREKLGRGSKEVVHVDKGAILLPRAPQKAGRHSKPGSLETLSTAKTASTTSSSTTTNTGRLGEKKRRHGMRSKHKKKRGSKQS